MPITRRKGGRFQTEVVVQTEEEKAAIKQKEDFQIAVTFLQRHERGRQARLYLNDILTFVRKKIVKAEEREDAAKVIQKFWRGHAARTYVRDKEDKRRILIGESCTL